MTGITQGRTRHSVDCESFVDPKIWYTSVHVGVNMSPGGLTKLVKIDQTGTDEGDYPLEAALKSHFQML